SLEAVNQHAFEPGDTVSFNRGGVWTGTLHAGGSGTAALPILYGAYGIGPAPEIRNPGVWYGPTAQVTGDWTVVQDFFVTGAHQAGVLIDSVADHNIVRDSEITGTGIGVLTRGQYNLITGNNVHDLNMIISDTTAVNDYGAVCFWIEGAHNEIACNRG